jgi:hypothetical protein
MSGTIRLRVTGRRPELWHADTGTHETVSFAISGGTTSIPLTLPTDGSVFIVFREPTTATRASIATARETTVRTLGGHWPLSFQSARGAPAGAIDSALMPWNDSSDARIRYFSGIGTYRTTLTLNAREARRPLSLDLGRVGDVARVTVNGRPAGIAWKAPYRLDVTDLLYAGSNDIRIEVANLWVNRLIGDAQPGATPIARSAGPTYAPDAPLRFSGLAGPVRLLSTAAAGSARRCAKPLGCADRDLASLPSVQKQRDAPRDMLVQRIGLLDRHAVEPPADHPRQCEIEEMHRVAMRIGAAQPIVLRPRP